MGGLSAFCDLEDFGFTAEVSALRVSNLACDVAVFF